MSGNDRVTKWAAIVGNWHFDATGSATYIKPQPSQRPFGLCICNTRFSEGTISFHLQSLGDVDGRIVLGYRSPSDDYFAIGLGGYGKSYTLTHFSLVGGWREIKGVGHISNLAAGKTYRLTVKVVGNRVSLEVDDVLVLEHDLPAPVPLGQVGLFAWGDQGRSTFSDVSIARTTKDIEQVVILVHGIRTFAEWQSMLAGEFSRVGIPVIPTSYGYFATPMFLAPIPWFRNQALARLRILIDQAKSDYPNAKISFLAHSFGTYLLARFLQEEPTFKAHKIVFCGSVVPSHFPFEQIRTRFEAPIVNEVSSRDPWPLIAESLTWIYGSVGTRGFNHAPVVDRWHSGFAHSQYLQQKFCDKYWLPFFAKDIRVESESFAEKPPLWIRLLGGLFSKYLLLLATALLIGLWPYIWINDKTPAANERSCRSIRVSTPDEWRSTNLQADEDGSFYVIVGSVSRFADYPVMNSSVAKLEAFRLGREFPTLSFDVMQTASVDGKNRMRAIVLARGLPDQSRACEIQRLARTCGVSADAYVYQLGQGPRGCQR